MTNADNIAVCLTDRQAILRISGRVNFKLSPDFKKVLRLLFERGQIQFVFDLSGCEGMDSTFLGVMAGFVTKTPPGPKGPPVVTLYRPQPAILGSLKELYMDTLFQYTDKLELSGANFQAPPATGDRPTREDFSITSLDAHKTLMNLNPDNIARFKDVVKFLEDELNQGK